MKTGQSPTIYSDGLQSRDFTYVSNVVEANLLACQKGLEELSGEVFNIAFGKRVTINDLVDSISQLSNTNVLPEYAEPRPGDVKNSFANIGKARQFLGYEPRIDFFEGLRKVI